MFPSSMLAMFGAIGAFALASPGVAAEGDPVCQALTVVARAANADAGTWLDRRTRNDGVEVLCRTRTVEFRRFAILPAGGLDSEWKERQQREWNRAFCDDYAWRPAVDAGWIIVLSLTTRQGEHASIVAMCR
jgi:hypothetical protein